MVSGNIICPNEHVKAVNQLCLSKRGTFKEKIDLTRNRVMLKYSLPLNEIILDFSDKLKWCTSGYASFDYEHTGYEKSDLVKLVICLNDVEIEELTQIVHVERATQIGRRLVEKLKEEVDFFQK